jgi:hypothetical protein
MIIKNKYFMEINYGLNILWSVLRNENPEKNAVPG